MEPNTELWKVIPGYDNYEASTCGRIRNKTTSKVLKPYNVEDGYSQIRLSLGSRKEFKVIAAHRLVAITWISNPDNKPTVNHINRNKYDNRVDNLEWNTHKEQSLHVINTSRKDKNITTILQHYENEEWKVIPAFPTLQVSNQGRIRNISGYIYKPYENGRYIHLKIKGKHIIIHRAVAEAFLSTFTPDCVINHLDGNRKNNAASNLECVTQSENLIHSYKIGLNSRAICIQQYDSNNNLLNEYPSYLQAARETQLKDATIRWSIRHNNGKHGGFIWKIKND